MDAIELNKHLAWAERLCSRRECCLFDLRTKLKARSVAPQELEGIIKTLIQQGFLNEERYVRAFVHDKSKLQGWGPQKIRFALCAKQIPDAVICAALENIDTDGQKETLRRLLEAKRRSVKGASAADVRAKLIRFGLARGFSYEDVMTVTKMLYFE